MCEFVVVSLGFDEAEVSYSEGDDEVFLSVNLNRPIADNFIVRVSGGLPLFIILWFQYNASFHYS